jgi:hypothetical protein
MSAPRSLLPSRAPALLAAAPWCALRPQLERQAAGRGAGTIEADVLATVQGLDRACVPAAPAGDAPLVSVIVTLYDCAPHVASCVASLKAQTHPAVEVILVDDCSHDDTCEVARTLARTYPGVVVLRTQRNAGTYVAKNLGLTMARGRYVSFQDCDDLSHPERLARQLAALRAEPARVATSCHYARIDEDSGELLLNRGERSRPGLISLMIDWPRVRDAVGFFDSVRVNADDEFKTRIRRVFGPGALAELPECHYFALLRQDGLTMTGHTANNIGSTELRLFLAPVRQRYTASFQHWHRAAAPAALAIEFPALRRPFPAPVSIDAFHGGRFAANALLVGRAQAAALALALPPLAGFVRRFFTQVVLLDEADAAEAADTPAELGGLPLQALRRQATPDKTLKELADLLGGGAVLMLDRAEDLAALGPDRLRRAMYTMMSARPRPVVVAFDDRPASYLPLEALDVAGTRFDARGPDLARAGLLAVLAAGGRLQFG